MRFYPLTKSIKQGEQKSGNPATSSTEHFRKIAFLLWRKDALGTRLVWLERCDERACSGWSSKYTYYLRLGHVDSKKVLVPFEMATIEETEITFQENENTGTDGSTDLTSFQFVPDKIIDFTISQVRNLEIAYCCFSPVLFTEVVLCGHG